MIILISGHKQSGKTTLATMMHVMNAEMKQYSYAEPVRRMILALYDYADNEGKYNHLRFVSGPDSERTKSLQLLPCASSRTLMQTLGTDWGRHIISPNIWKDIFIERIKSDSATCGLKHAVVDDVRFPNELALPDSLLGPVVHIHIQRDADKVYDDAHESESHEPYMHDNARFLVDNNSTLEALREAARYIVETVQMPSFKSNGKQHRINVERDAYGV